MSVCLFVCLCVHLLRYRLTVFLPPLTKVDCPKFLEIWNSWGKLVERRGLRFEFFLKNGLKSPPRKKLFTDKKKFTFELQFKHHFAPTSQKLMSNFFKDSELLGKSSGKKWSQMWIVLLKNGLKMPWQKKFFLQISPPLFTPFKRLFAPISWDPMSKLFRYSKFLGENIGKKWSQIWVLLLIKGVKSQRKKKIDFWRILPY